jgi:hypothetical protein
MAGFGGASSGFAAGVTAATGFLCGVFVIAVLAVGLRAADLTTLALLAGAFVAAARLAAIVLADFFAAEVFAAGFFVVFFAAGFFSCFSFSSPSSSSRSLWLTFRITRVQRVMELHGCLLNCCPSVALDLRIYGVPNAQDPLQSCSFGVVPPHCDPGCLSIDRRNPRFVSVNQKEARHERHSRRNPFHAEPRSVWIESNPGERCLDSGDDAVAHSK